MDAIKRASIPSAAAERSRPVVFDLHPAGPPPCDGMVGDGSATIGFARAVDAWLGGSCSPALRDLAAATGLSRRQLERRCNAVYGVPPQLLARRHRALRAAARLAAGERCDEDGFYDQSHMIREIKRFTGLTPGQIRTDPTSVVPALGANDSQPGAGG